MRRTLLSALALLVLAAPFTAQAASQLQSRIDTERTSLLTGEELVLRFALTNTGPRSAQILRWHTPLQGVDDDLFEVSRNGEPVAYLGRMFKRGVPTPSDYLRVLPGETLSANVPLASLYDLSRPGEYTVRYRLELSDAFGRGDGERAELLSSNTLTLWLEGEDLSELGSYELEGSSPDALTPVYRNCTSSRKTALASALSSSQTYTGNGLAYLNAGSKGARYTTWFGTYTSSRYATVRSHYGSLDSTIRTKTITFDCGCTDSAYAYVYPNQPYIVYLCNAFWSAPTGGTDSKAGTIVHELSHFYVVASTDDWAYGQTACKSLARSNPKKATDNADSHEYFAENTPAQN